MEESRRNKIIRVDDGKVTLEPRTEEGLKEIRLENCICFGCANALNCGRVLTDIDSKNNIYIDAYKYVLEAIESVDENGIWDLCAVTHCRNYQRGNNKREKYKVYKARHKL